jgi:hypothetical protein
LLADDEKICPGTILIPSANASWQSWVLMGASLRDAITVPVYRYWINGGLALLTITTVRMFWMP